MYDSFHANIEEKNQAAAIASVKDETIHVHVSENDRGVPGTGGVSWDSFWSGIKSTNYDGYLTIGFGRPPCSPPPLESGAISSPTSKPPPRRTSPFIKKSTG